QKWGFLLITIVFIYTTIVNSVERPDGIKIASFFIAIILISSLISGVLRSTELRVKKVVLDETAEQFIRDAADKGAVRLLAHRPGGPSDYAAKAAEAVTLHHFESAEKMF